MIDFQKLILEIIAAFLIYVAIDYKRPKQYEIKMNTKEWWLQLFILVIALTLIQQANT